MLRDQIREFQPDWVLVSSEDLGHVLLREAARAAPGRIVYLAHTPQFFPVRPGELESGRDAATDLVARAAAVVAIGHHTAEYIRDAHGPRRRGDPSADLRQRALPESGARSSDGLITMINPCAVKGISIFLALADRFPQHGFGALPGWGTTSGGPAASSSGVPTYALLPNVQGHRAGASAQTRVLLMPSLWYEGFGLSVMEAMLRGIPVVASDSGGLVEAKMGTGFVVPARGIERFEPVFDEHGMPQPVIPEIDIEPWVEALGALLSDPSAYTRESQQSREAALRFVDGSGPRGSRSFWVRSRRPPPG